MRIQVENFAHIKNVDVELGDLTVLVGAQGTGKSLTLQWLKAALDGRQVMQELAAAGQAGPKSESAVVDLIFGVGMGPAWKGSTVVRLDGEMIKPLQLKKTGSLENRAFYIPAHRAMLISDGWAAPFQKLTAETPVVARLFSDALFRLFSEEAGDLFPLKGLLKHSYRDLIDQAVFHGATVAAEEDSLHSKRLKLKHGTEAQLPFMTWTAGQREFTPLLMGLYHLLRLRKQRKHASIDVVIIEEPEMGLHPQAVSVFMLLVLDMLWRGYKVVVATHSPIVLAAMWMMRRLSEMHARWQLVAEAFGVTQQPFKPVAEASLTKRYLTYLLQFDEAGQVVTKNISTLDPSDDDDAVSGWGGLAGFASHYGEVVRKAANEIDQ